MKNIELPRRIVVGGGAIHLIVDLCRDLGLKGNPLVISGQQTYEIAGKKIRNEFSSGVEIVKDSSDIGIKHILDRIKKDEIDFVVGVGGGQTIDVGKFCAYKSGIPFISVPTAASHDGIASPRVSLKRKGPVSIKVHSPLAMIADTEIIGNAPYRLLAAGCSDAISNYTAVLDWKLARDEKNEYYGDYAANLSLLSAQVVMENAESIRTKKDISTVVEALISSGIAIGIAGSSRPCSGSEHLFSHALDTIAPTLALHGEQCGVGAIMMAYLHDSDWIGIRRALKIIGAPINAKELGIGEKYVVKALTIAHKIRDRYTILRDGLSHDEARELAKVTGVI